MHFIVIPFLSVYARKKKENKEDNGAFRDFVEKFVSRSVCKTPLEFDVRIFVASKKEQ